MAKAQRSTSAGRLEELDKMQNPAIPYVEQNQGSVRGDMYSDIQRQIDDLNRQSLNLSSGFLGLQSGSRDAARAQINAQISKLKSQLTGAKAAFGALDNQIAPTMTPQMIARLKALEAESEMGPLATDPLFQGDRATLVQGGAQALAGLGSAQKMSRFGTGGQGNVQDIYDRLGVQLSQLGQQSRQTKESKRDVVAQSYQAFEDAKRDFENKSKMAEAAIISGNLEQAYQAIEAAAQAEARMRESQQSFTNNLLGNVIKGGVAAASYGLAGPADGGAASLGGATGEVLDPDGNIYTNFSSGATLPGQLVDPFAATAPVRTFKK